MMAWQFYPYKGMLTWYIGFADPVPVYAYGPGILQEQGWASRGRRMHTRVKPMNKENKVGA